MRALPNGYVAHPYVDKMYAGYWPQKNYGEGLFVVLKQEGETDTEEKYFMFTSDLEKWKSNGNSYGSIAIGELVRYGLLTYLYTDYNCLDTTEKQVLLFASSSQMDSGGRRYVFVIKQDKTTLSSSSTIIEAIANSSNAKSDGTGRINYSFYVAALCYCPLLEKLLIFLHCTRLESNTTVTPTQYTYNYNTYVYQKPLGKNVITASESVGIVTFNINPGCVAWSGTQQVFCCSGVNTSGINKIATSSDGVNWTEHTIPDNFLDLTYRENLGCFIARGETTKLFYASGDGETWQPVTQTPIPLETVAAVDYNPENEWYCAVGGTGKYAYFSKDLEHWIPTTISNSDVTAGSVIYMPSTGLYVLMPTSGSYYYTFNPENWTELSDF